MILIEEHSNELLTNNFLLIKSLDIQDGFQLLPQRQLFATKGYIVSCFKTISTAINMPHYNVYVMLLKFLKKI